MKRRALSTVAVIERRVIASDGFSLAARIFRGSDPSRGTVIIHGATATPQAYYGPFASHLAAHGFDVVTYDYRGVGRSRPRSLAGFEATMMDWAARDARAMVGFVERELPGPLSSVGHSFGAQLVGLIDDARRVKRAVFVGPQLGFMGHWPLAERPRLGLFWYGLVPTLTATLGYLPAWSGLGEELPAGVAREWGRWCRSPGYYLDHEPEAAARLGRFDRPTLVHTFTDDDFAPAAGVEAFLAKLPRASITHRRHAPEDLGVAGIGHFGFFRERFANTLWKETVQLLSGELAPRRAPTSLREPHLALALEGL